MELAFVWNGSVHFSEKFLLAFIPLFVAIDAVGILPVFWNLTSEMEPAQRKHLITQASMTALVVSIVFLFSGHLIFRFLGINENDFRVAGGLVLLTISIIDLSFSRPRPSGSDRHLGVVPIGVPLTIGPAALTTCLIQAEAVGYAATLLALVINIGIVWMLFRKSQVFLRIFGDAGARAAGKVMALFLAAIAIMMIRVGLTHMIRG